MGWVPWGVERRAGWEGCGEWCGGKGGVLEVGLERGDDEGMLRIGGSGR